jgi:hypothetical protein
MTTLLELLKAELNAAYDELGVITAPLSPTVPDDLHPEIAALIGTAIEIAYERYSRVEAIIKAAEREEAERAEADRLHEDAPCPICVQRERAAADRLWKRRRVLRKIAEIWDTTSGVIALCFYGAMVVLLLLLVRNSIHHYFGI